MHGRIEYFPAVTGLHECESHLQLQIGRLSFSGPAICYSFNVDQTLQPVTLAIS